MIMKCLEYIHLSLKQFKYGKYFSYSQGTTFILELYILPIYEQTVNLKGIYYWQIIMELQ